MKINKKDIPGDFNYPQNTKRKNVGAILIARNTHR